MKNQTYCDELMRTRTKGELKAMRKHRIQPGETRWGREFGDVVYLLKEPEQNPHIPQTCYAAYDKYGNYLAGSVNLDGDV